MAFEIRYSRAVRILQVCQRRHITMHCLRAALRNFKALLLLLCNVAIGTVEVPGLNADSDTSYPDEIFYGVFQSQGTNWNISLSDASVTTTITLIFV
jgi:hypothetical protein